MRSKSVECQVIIFNKILGTLMPDKKKKAPEGAFFKLNRSGLTPAFD